MKNKNKVCQPTSFVFVFSNLIIAFLCCNMLYAVETKMTQAMQSLYNLKFYEADSLISIIEKTNNTHYLTHIARANYYWWHIITNAPDNIYHERYLNELVSAKKIMHEHQFNDLNHLETFYNIYVYASMARIDLMNESYLYGLRNLNKSVRFINASMGNEHLFKPFLLTSGLYNYLVDHGNKLYPMFRIYTMFLPKANRQKGLRQLKTAAELDDPVIKTESHYFLMKIFQELEKNFQNALIHARWLTENYPENLVFLYHHYEISKQLELDEAQTVFQRIMNQLEFSCDLSESQKKHFRELINSD